MTRDELIAHLVLLGYAPTSWGDGVSEGLRHWAFDTESWVWSFCTPASWDVLSDEDLSLVLHQARMGDEQP